MGSQVLTIAIIIELTLAIYSLTTKSLQEKARSGTRIAAFIVFLLLTLVSVLEWGLRWYGLAILLFLWAAHGVLTLIHRKDVRDYSARRIMARFVLSLLLVFLALVPALIFPPHKPLVPTGPYTVATVRHTYMDENRIEQFSRSGENRRVNVTFWYPQNPNSNETFPLIVFSHGGLGTEYSNESLFLELASHGYVIASIGHPYHAFWTEDENGHVTFVSMDYFRQLQQEDAKRDKQESYRYYREWMETRTGDINFAIDTILEKASTSTGGVYSLIDVERIGVMGHSLGGSAVLGVPRQRSDIDAVMALESPFLCDIVGVENGEFVFIQDAYPVPVLNVYSDASWSHLSEWTQYARNHDLLLDPQADAFNLYLRGAGHFSLTDLSLASPLLVRVLEGGETTRDATGYLRELNEVSLAFFDQYLKDRGDFKTGFYQNLQEANP